MNMKLVVLALSGVLLSSTAARADECDPSFYVGGEVQANQYKGEKRVTTPRGATITATDNKKSLFGKGGAGASVMAGARLHENFGAEIGATALSNSRLNIVNGPRNTLKTRSHNLYADAMGYVPVSREVDLIGAVGVGHLTTKLNGNLAVNSEKVSMKSSKAGLRVGLGAQYKLCENVNARFMVRHQKGNKFVKSVNSAGLGLSYQF